MAIKLILFSVIFFNSCLGQSQKKFKYQSIHPSDYFSDTAYQSQFNDEIREIYEKGFNIKDALPEGYLKDGSVDYTKYIQQAINQYSYLIFPSFPLLIKDNGLDFHSNTHAVFEKGGMILMSPSKKSFFQAFRIQNCSNVSLFYPEIVGDRDKHLGKTGEWGMGIYIISSNNIKIYSSKISSCWGDGMYISGNKTPSSNIKIINSFLDNNRRNAISIINVRNLEMVNILATNTYGTNPMSGIDIEPNKNTDTMDSLLFKNVYTINNYQAGFKIQLRSLLRPDIVQDVNIHIIDMFSSGSEYSFYLGPVLKMANAFSGLPQPIKGKIIIENPIWINYLNKPLTAWNYGQIGPDVEISNPQIKSTEDKLFSSFSNKRIETEEGVDFLKKSVITQPKIIIN
jgi:hypothetical protein